jgi:DMSO/TMAO reductase YedYZ molybdopterin-dependent catalytic subunit
MALRHNNRDQAASADAALDRCSSAEGPDIAPEQWRLTVDGMADKPLTVTYDELTAGFTGLNR